MLALFVVHGTVSSDSGRAAGAAIIYMLPLMALGGATEKPLSRKADALPFPSDWIVYGAAKLAIGVATAAIGTALATLLRIMTRWEDIYLANRMVVVFSFIASCILRLYDSTRGRLERRNRELQERVEQEARTLRIHEQDLERAREIQQALMPKQLPQIRRCDLAAGCKPARIVGGDYYDAIRLSESSLALAIADVSGKGMGAALLMSNLQAIVRAFAPSGLRPDELCIKANELIAANVAPGKYITFFCAIVDTARMRLDYCSAGHNPPVLQHPDRSIETLSEGGPVLGVFPGAKYESATADLRPGDCLVLFTDGITEAANGNEEEFGEDRLVRSIANRHDGAEGCRTDILNAVTEFSNGTFHDDATLLVLTVE